MWQPLSGASCQMDVSEIILDWLLLKIRDLKTSDQQNWGIFQAAEKQQSLMILSDIAVDGEPLVFCAHKGWYYRWLRN